MIRYFVYYFRIIDIIYSVFAILFTFFLGSIIWGSGYASPLFVEQLCTIELKEIDTLFHSAVAGIIKTYNIPSTGLDGIPFLPYHWGSHWIFAQFSSLINVSALQFYNLCYPIIFIPLFFKCFFMFIINIRKYKKISIGFGWLFYLVIIFVFIHFLSNISRASIVSESYFVGLTFTFLILAIIIELIDNIIERKKHLSYIENIFIIILLPIILGFIVLTKISIGYILLGLYGYLFLRVKLFKTLQLTISFIISFILFSLIYFYTAKTVGGISAGINIFNTLNAFLRFGSISFIVHYIWVLSFIVLYLYKKGIRTFGELKKSFLSKNIMELEFLVVILVLGLFPGLVLDFRGSGAEFYFFNIQYWIGLGLFLAYLPYFINDDQWLVRLKVKNIKTYFIMFIFFCLTIEISKGYFKDVKENIKYYFYVRQSIIDGEKYPLDRYNGKQLISKALNYHKSNNVFKSLVAYSKLSQSALDGNYGYKLLQIIKDYDRLELSQKRKTCIYIPKTNRVFWDMQTFSRYDGTPFIVPALSGIAMIDGLPDYLSPISRRARGYNVYNKDYNDKNPENYTDLNLEQVKSLAQLKGFSRIIKIGYYNNEFVVEEIEI